MIKELLTDKDIQATKATTKVIRLSDGNGLYLLVKPNNSRWWRVDYTIKSKRKTLSLGTYPLISLSNAREKAFELKKLVANGVDPSTTRKEVKNTEKIHQQNEDRVSLGLTPINSFKDVADEWYKKKMQNMAASYKGRVYSRLERDIFPFVGNKQIKDISAQELLAIIQKIEERGAIESAHRTLRTCSQIFKYGIITGRVEQDVTTALKGALLSVKGGHFSAITDTVMVKYFCRVSKPH